MRYPRHVTLELTAKCNFRCPYCYCVWHEYPALAKPELDAAGWKTILDKCAADGVEDILFTGGEALLRRDLFKILSYARRVLPKANFGEAADMFVAAALSGASTIQVGPVILGGRAAANQALMISRDEWEEVKRRIRSLPDAHVSYTFCDEFICSCRADTPKPLLEKWEEKNRKPCPAGKSFGVIGPNGLYRTCLHSLPQGV